VSNLVAELRAIDTATVTNAMDRLEPVSDATPYEYSSFELRCLTPDLPPMVGYAITCTGDSTSPRGHPTSPRNVDRRNRIRALYEAIRNAGTPVVVACQNVGTERLMSNHFGDIMSTAFQALGAVGAITDGGIRDLDGIRRRAPGFHVFAPGAVPSGGVATIVDVGVPVSICGMEIRPGDLLHGDLNGVTSIPERFVASVVAMSLDVLRAEREKIDFIAGPGFDIDGLARRSHW
jgi:4-hydroxy-4-methyl-2-oxoglutarate aldolase